MGVSVVGICLLATVVLVVLGLGIALLVRSGGGDGGRKRFAVFAISGLLLVLLIGLGIFAAMHWQARGSTLREVVVHVEGQPVALPSTPITEHPGPARSARFGELAPSETERIRVDPWLELEYVNDLGEVWLEVDYDLHLTYAIGPDGKPTWIVANADHAASGGLSWSYDLLLRYEPADQTLCADILVGGDQPEALLHLRYRVGPDGLERLP